MTIIDVNNENWVVLPNIDSLEQTEERAFLPHAATIVIQ